MIDNIANWLVVVLCFWCIAWKWEMYRLTRVRWVFVIMCGFIFTAVVRVGIVAHSPFFVGHSKALTAVTFGFFALGIPMLVQVLRRAYRINGTTSVLDTTAQIKSAADAAQKLRQHAMDAAEHARLAGLHALEAAAFADRATAQSRQATKDSGIANEASRKADEDVGNDAVT